MTLELGLSCSAFLISILSVVYSRSRLEAAKKANKIAIHNRTSEVLSDLRSFSEHFKVNAEETSPEQYSKLKSATTLSRLYFSKEAVLAIRRYESAASAVMRAKNLLELRKLYEITVPEDALKDLDALAQECNQLARKAISLVETETKLVDH